MILANEDIVSSTCDRFPCREYQIRQVASLLVELDPAPPNIILYGLEATGKTEIVTQLLAAGKIRHATVRSLECITARHFFECIVGACLEAVTRSSNDNVNRKIYARCESISVLASHLQRMLEGSEKFVLVLDGVDRQKDATPTLIPALARLAEIIPCLTTVMIVSAPGSRFLQVSGTPYIHFPSYTREETLQIVSKDPLPIFTTPTSPSRNYSEKEVTADSMWLWARYCGALWDSLGNGAARDIVAFRRLAEKLWEPFVTSVQDGTFGPRDFSRLMVSKRNLFQSETALSEKMEPNQVLQATNPPLEVVHDLPYYTKFLICAAYLASYNPARLDPTFFMKSTERKRKKGGGRLGRPPKYRKIPRRLLGPSSFSLERLLAILHAIAPHPDIRTDEIYAQIATLTSLRLLLRSSGVGSGSTLEPTSKWKVNVSWDYIVAVARSVGFEMAEWMAE